jgi:hypothetical protein
VFASRAVPTLSEGKIFRILNRLSGSLKSLSINKNLRLIISKVYVIILLIFRKSFAL